MEANSKRNLNFFDLWENRAEWIKKKSLANMVAWYKKTSPETPLYNVWWRIFNVYFGSINQFKPLIAMGIYCRYKPTSVLDFTMGWGGRLVGACALDVPKYTGVDLNPDLEKPYADMVKELSPLTSTKIKLYFQDALTVDYNKLDYDLVLTSPPYYNIELYKGTKQRGKDEWDREFYEPIFIKTWNGMKMGGHYCLNVPAEVYDRVCIKLMGKADEFLPLYKAKRKAGDTYKEFIYVWKKTANLKAPAKQPKITELLKPIEGKGVEFPISLPKPTFKNEWVVGKKSKVAGYGAFAKKDIPKGTKIADYIGDEMTTKEFKKQYGGTYGERKDIHPYAYVLGRVNKLIVASGKYLTENVVSYVNEIPPNYNVELKQRALFAKKDIKKGTELSLQYPKNYGRHWLTGGGIEEDDPEPIDESTKASPTIKKLLYGMTPVERAGDNWIKREDKFEYADQLGGKVRSALFLMTKDKYKGITTAGNRNSPQINIVSSIGKKLGIPIYAFTSRGELGDEVKVAQTKGAKITQVKPGYESVINARAREFSEKNGYLYVPFGMDTEAVHHLTANQVKNIPKEVKRIVVPVGSASSIIGIIKGVKEYRPDIKILGVVVGANPLRKLNKYVPDWRKYMSLKHYKGSYSEPAEETRFGGICLDPYYEAKTIPYIKKGDMLWIVGVRETIDQDDC